MEFHEKLQELRKQKGLTQEELAERLYVSRAAVSKWESGRGYPNLESLKAIAVFFSVSIDNLLSGAELLTIAEEDTAQRTTHTRDLVFGLLDCGVSLLLFLPFFGQRADGVVQGVSLLTLTQPALWMRLAYAAVVIGMTGMGILTLTLQTCRTSIWVQNKWKLSLLLHAVSTLLFIVGLQPYAAAFLFLFLSIKVLMLIKWR